MMKSPRITYHHLLKITSLLILLVLLSCGSKKAIEPNQINSVNNPKILFLNFSVKKESLSNKSIKFINKIEADGKLKQNNFLKEGSQGDLSCELLNKKGKSIESFIIKDPLFKTIEYVDESKNFKVKQFELDSAQLSLRIQLKPSASYISISEIDTLKKILEPLIITKLN